MSMRMSGTVRCTAALKRAVMSEAQSTVKA